MKSLLLFKRLFLHVLFIGGVLGATAASAQYTIVNPSTGDKLIHVDGGTSPSYTFTASGSHTQGTPVWSVRGDLQIVSQTTTSVVVRSTGFGKGRIVLTFNQGSGACSGGQTATRDVYKIFSPPHPIVGPSCVRPGERATFSVTPVVSQAAQIASEIGVDSYQWFIDGVPVGSSSWWSTPAVTYLSGDGSSVTVLAPTNLSGNPVLSVVVGSANTATPRSITLATKANVPVFSTNLAPTCLPVGSGAGPFQVSVVNEPGVTYTWSVTGTNWTATGQIVANGLNTVTITPGLGSSEIAVVAKASDASCESAVNRVTVNRTLSTTNTITASVSGCLTVNSPVTFTLSNAPSGGIFQWQAPSGWSPSTATGVSAIFTPSASAPAGGQISVINTLCSSGSATITPVVSNNQGLTFTIEDLDCGLYRVNAPGFSRTGATYKWFLGGIQMGTTTGNTNAFTFDPTNWTSAKDISVQITKNSPNCLDASALLPSQTYHCSDGLLAATNVTAARASSEISAYPNPTSDRVTLTLPNDESVKQVLLEDQYGKVHKRFNTLEGTLTLDVSTLPQGLYMVTVKTGNQTVTKKVKIER